MTILVSSPDGSSVQFPDGTDSAVINDVMTKHFKSAAPSGAPTVAPDKYQQAAIDEQAALKAAGGDEGAGLTRRLAHGATLGADSTILAAAQTPLEMVKRGTFNPVEGYNYAKAREDQIMGDARKNTGAVGTAAEILGGGVAGAGLAHGGVTAARLLAPEAGLLARTGASAADAGAFGAVSGAMEGNGLEERGINAAKGAGVGLALGAAAPVAISTVGGMLSPVISNIKARTNPRGYAESQVARAIHESGVSPNQLSLDVVQAGNEGQGAYTLADAMGNAGQRMLSTVARAPGEGRTAVVNALDARQADQGRRVTAALAEGFDSPTTAAQTEARLTQARNQAADHEYGAVRNDAAPVDLSGAIAHADQTLQPGVNQIARPQSGIANDSAEAALQHFRDRLTDGRSVLTDFAAVQRVRGDLSDAVQAAHRAGAGNKARLLGGLLREVDGAMENASAGHLAANRNFSQASRDIEAVQSGRDAAMRGRTEDIIPQFQGLTPEGQQAFRSGYVDPLIAQTQGAAFGANKARPLINDAFRAESDVMAPGAAMMQRRLGREQTMFETRGQALGGSRTMDNINDHAAMAVDPHVIGKILMGDFHGALKGVLQAGSNVVSGNTAAVRQEVANILLQRAPTISAPALERMVDHTINRLRHVQDIARNVGRAMAGGIAATAPGQQRQRVK